MSKADTVRVAHGNVVNIKSIPTRGVTRIEIELPIEAHVEATRLLFGQDVLVMASSMPSGTPYGIVSSGTTPVAEAGEDAPSTSADSGAARGASAFSGLARRPGERAPSERAQGERPSMLGRREDAVNIPKWLGIRCADASFQDWLEVRTEADAITKVRQICGVTSRSEITSNPMARDRFFREIYSPFIAHTALVNGVSASEIAH